MNKVLLYLSTLLFIITSGCTKDANVNSSNKRLIQIIPGGADSIGYVWLTYDNQNRLIGIKDSNDHYPTVNYSTLKYDNQGRVNKVIISGDFTSTITLLYNNNNQVIEKIMKNADTSTVGELTRYYYDAKNRMILDSVYGDLNATNAYYYNSFTYDDNDNLINMIYHPQYNGQWEAYQEIDYLGYDNKLNVYKDLKVLWFILEDNMILSKNNVTSYSYYYTNQPNQKDVWKFTYTYNNDLITDVAFNRGGSIIGSRHFVYN